MLNNNPSHFRKTFSKKYNVSSHRYGDIIPQSDLQKHQFKKALMFLRIDTAHRHPSICPLGHHWYGNTQESNKIYYTSYNSVNTSTPSPNSNNPISENDPTDNIYMISRDATIHEGGGPGSMYLEVWEFIS